MNRLLFLTVGLLSLPSVLLAQTIKDFYLPVEAFNKTNLYTPDPRTGTNTGMEASIWFINKGSNYDIMEAKLFKGKATSITTETVSITSNEVLLLKTVNTN
nr:hypothetical protein [Sediminibacterium sp.]